MAERHLLIQKIRSYLEALSPRAVDKLMRGLETSHAQGSEDPHIRLILQACADVLRAEQAAVNTEPRKKWLKRLFFRPVECLLMDEVLPSRQKARITRSSLEGIWSWIDRFVAPDEVRRASERVLQLEVSAVDAATIAGRLRDQVVPMMRAAIAEAQADETARRRLSMMLGGERVLLDLFDLVEAFEAEAWLTPFLESLPERLTDWDLKGNTPTTKRVKAVADRHQDGVPLVAAAVMNRAENPGGLTSLACTLASTTDARKLANSPYSGFVDVVLSEAERLAVLANRADDNDALPQALSKFHSLVRHIEREIDLLDNPDWHKRLSTTRRTFAAVVTQEFQASPGNIRRALQVPPVSAAGKPIVDGAAVDQADRALQILKLMRGGAESLAVSEVTTRTRQAVEQTLEIMTRSLLADLDKTAKAGGSPQRTACLAAVDVAIRLCETYFGKDYAALIRRRRNAAIGEKTKGKAVTIA